MIQVLPAILDKTPEDFKRHADQLNHSDLFKDGWVHIDFADNKFVPNGAIGPEEVAKYPLNLNKEAHLMVTRPLEWIDKLRKVGFKRVVFHFESDDDPVNVVNKIKEEGMEAGIALKMETPIEKLEPFKDKIDLVLIMSIVPGFQGQPFLPKALERIKSLKEKGWPIRISVDGSVRDTNAKQIAEAGADQLSVGSFLLTGDINENMEKLWEALK